MSIYVRDKAAGVHKFYSQEEIVEHLTRRLQPSSYPDGQCEFIKNILHVCQVLVGLDRKIVAIGLIKNCFPLGLAEAKEFIEIEFRC